MHRHTHVCVTPRHRVREQRGFWMDFEWILNGFWMDENARVKRHVTSMKDAYESRHTCKCCAVWLVHTCVWHGSAPHCWMWVMAGFHVWHDSFVVCMSDMIHASVWHVSTCAMVDSHVWHDTFMCGMTHAYVPHTFRSHVTHVNGSCHTHARVMSHVSVIQTTHIHEPCHIYEQSHPTHIQKSCQTYEWVMQHTHTRHDTHINESCHTYARGTSRHIYKQSHAKKIVCRGGNWALSKINESCHTHKQWGAEKVIRRGRIWAILSGHRVCFSSAAPLPFWCVFVCVCMCTASVLFRHFNRGIRVALVQQPLSRSSAVWVRVRVRACVLCVAVLLLGAWSTHYERTVFLMFI